MVSIDDRTIYNPVTTQTWRTNMVKVQWINGHWIAKCGTVIVARDRSEGLLREQLEDLGIEVMDEE